jgi:hypothetical protein
VTAIAAAALCVQAAARAAVDVVSIGGTEPLIQHLRSEGAAVLVPAVSQGKVARQARMRRCMQSWDPATQTSKREWRSTCRRVIIQQPGMFGPDPL